MDDVLLILTEQDVRDILFTLRKIKPRNFNSMDRLVALVKYFEDKVISQHNITTQPQQQTPEDPEQRTMDETQPDVAEPENKG